MHEPPSVSSPAPQAVPPAAAAPPRPRWIGALVAVLLALGLLAHVMAAHASGGSRIAYIHHTAGFFIIAAVTGLPFLGVAWLVRRRAGRGAGRSSGAARWGSAALLAFAVLQATLGLLIYVDEVRRG